MGADDAARNGSGERAQPWGCALARDRGWGRGQRDWPSYCLLYSAPMTPFLQAAAVYEREPCARTFEEDLYLHLMHGTVISTPEVFAMVRPVFSRWPVESLKD